MGYFQLIGCILNCWLGLLDGPGQHIPLFQLETKPTFFINNVGNKWFSSKKYMEKFIVLRYIKKTCNFITS